MSTVLVVLLTGLLLGLIYTLAGMGLSLSLGVLGILNMLHGMAVVAGAFVTYDLNRSGGVHPLLGAALCLPLFMAFGAALDWAVLHHARHRSNEAALLVLFGLMTTLQAVAVLHWTSNGRSLSVDYGRSSLSVGGAVLRVDYLVAGGTALVALLVLHAIMRLTFVGRAMQALSQRPDAARILGVHVDRYSVLVFALSMGIAAASGGVLITVFTFAIADQSLWLAFAFIVVLVGGTGRVINALAGGLALGIAQATFNQTLPLNYVDTVVYGLLVAALVVRGGGLASRKERQL